MSKNIDYDDIADSIFEETNKVRKNPQSYIPKLKECLNNFRDKIYHRPGEDPIQTY